MLDFRDLHWARLGSWALGAFKVVVGCQDADEGIKVAAVNPPGGGVLVLGPRLVHLHSSGALGLTPHLDVATAHADLSGR